VIRLKICERNPHRINANHTEMARQSQQTGCAVPGERCEKGDPFGQQLSHSASRHHWARMGEGLAQQRADVVPAAPRNTERLRGDHLQPAARSCGIGVDLAWRCAEEPRDRLHRRDFIPPLNGRQIRLLNQRDDIGERRS
jgi:hypothetical protein